MSVPSTSPSTHSTIAFTSTATIAITYILHCKHAQSAIFILEPMALVSRPKKPQLKDRDWEPWKDFVYVEYLVKNRELDEVVAELQSYNLNVKYFLSPHPRASFRLVLISPKQRESRSKA